MPVQLIPYLLNGIFDLLARRHIGGELTTARAALRSDRGCREIEGIEVQVPSHKPTSAKADYKRFRLARWSQSAPSLAIASITAQMVRSFTSWSILRSLGCGELYAGADTMAS